MLMVVILTKDEELHIARAIQSVADIADRVVVVDSGSKDRTVEIARDHGADVLINPWRNHATQFNWALEQLPKSTDWVMRLDADEIVTRKLAAEISDVISNADQELEGIYVPRWTTFLRGEIKYGGQYPVYLLRVFRFNKGRCENRWMDEHIQVNGNTIALSGPLIDDNLRPLTWWIEKHNNYASREVIDLLNSEYHFLDLETVASLRGGSQVGVKRWIKEKVYLRMPIGVRAFVYFLYRYIFRFGFLDGKRGLLFHSLQGLWYRLLVDAKRFEVQQYMRQNNVGPEEAIKEVLGIRVR